MDKRVCRECYLRHMPGKTPLEIAQAWDDFGDVWFENGQVECPTEIIREEVERSSERLFRATKGRVSHEDMNMLSRALDLLRENTQSRRTCTMGEPPTWCPYKRKHWAAVTNPSRRILWHG